MGILSFTKVLDLTDEEIERVMRVNAVGPMIATRDLAAYGASKGALLSFTRGAATVLARHGIRVNAVVPGWMSTDVSESVEARPGPGLEVRIPMRRPAHPAELVAGVCFLLSDEVGYADGTTLAIDGGWMGY